MFSSRRPEAITPKQAQGMLGRWYMPFFSGTMVHNFTLDNSKHVLKTWHVRKKNSVPLYWSPKHWIYFKTTVSIPFFTFLVTPVHIQCPLWKCVILTFPHLFFMLICFKLLITQTFFDFSKKLELLGVDCIKFTKSTNQSSWTDSGRV